MNPSGMTLRQFFLADETSTGEAVARKTGETEEMAAIEQRITRDARVVNWPAVRDEISGKIRDLLDISLVDIMVGAWKKYDQIRESLEKSARSPGETILVPLAEHTITSEHHPFVEVLVNEKQVGKIVFDLHVELTIQGLVLKIEGGKITEIRAAAYEGKGSIGCEGHVLVERSLKPVELPVAIELGDGAGL